MDEADSDGINTTLRGALVKCQLQEIYIHDPNGLSYSTCITKSIITIQPTHLKLQPAPVARTPYPSEHHVLRDPDPYTNHGAQ